MRDHVLMEKSHFRRERRAVSRSIGIKSAALSHSEQPGQEMLTTKQDMHYAEFNEDEVRLIAGRSDLPPGTDGFLAGLHAARSYQRI